MKKFIRRLIAAQPQQQMYRPPELFPGVVPADVTPQIAMDSASYQYANSMYVGDTQSFPGYPYLAQLSTRAEYRTMAGIISTELTREWIEFESTQTDGDDSGEKIKQLTAELERLKLRKVMQSAATNECFFGRGQIFINIKDHDKSLPLIISKATIPQGSLESFVSVEPMWTTPSQYNANDPTARDFYKPTRWYMMGVEIHASRLLTVVSRPLPDMLKPAFNFSGMSLSQLAEPYVNNWLRTRQAVSDLLDKFSVTALKTNMAQVLQGDDLGDGLMTRAELFTLLRSNMGLMLLDNDSEDLVQLNVPLSGLDKLQAQSQEHMSSVSRIPLVKFTGISPSGLNATSDGEIRVFYDSISADQESFWRDPLDVCIKVAMLNLWGEIDNDITWKFKPLWQMSELEQSTIRAQDGATTCAYVDRGILGPDEVRAQLAVDDDGAWDGLEINDDEVNENGE